MEDYSSGDTILTKIGYGKIFPSDSEEFEIIQAFDIICLCENGYLISLPTSLYLKNSFILTIKDCKKYGLHIKFTDASAHYITNNHIVALKYRMEGYSCSRCSEHSFFAEVNRLDENGKGVYLCYLCRTFPYR